MNLRKYLFTSSFITILTVLFVLLVAVAAHGAGDVPAITITTPNGGESFNVGDTITIRWQQSGVASIVAINYTTGPGSANPIGMEQDAFNPSRVVVNGGEGSYVWTIPKYVANQSASRQIKIKVAAYPGGNAPYVEDESNNFFTVNDPNYVDPSPPVSLQPVDVQLVGSSYAIGSTQIVQWTSVCQASSADVWLVTDSDSDGWELLYPLSSFAFQLVGGEIDHNFTAAISPSADSMPNSGTLQWKVPTDVRLLYNAYNQTTAEQAHESLTIARKPDGTKILRESLLKLAPVKLVPGVYRIRVDLHGSCHATGLSQQFSIGSATLPNQPVQPPTGNSNVMCPASIDSGALARARELTHACDKYNPGTLTGTASCTDSGTKYCFPYSHSGMACVVDVVSGRVEIRFSCSSGTLDVAVPGTNSNSPVSVSESSVVVREKELVYTIDNRISNRLRGRILLQTESKGEAWYVAPTDGKKYYLADGPTAYQALRKFGLGVANTDISKIPIGLEDRVQAQDTDSDGLPDKLEEAIGTDPTKADSDGDGYTDSVEIKSGFNPNGAGKITIDSTLIKRLAGKIILQVQDKGQAWYVNPVDGKRYYMADGSSAYDIMRYKSLGVTNQDIRRIAVGNF